MILRSLFSWWTLLSLLAAFGLLYIGAWLGYDRGWHRGRRALIREQQRRSVPARPGNITLATLNGRPIPKRVRPLFDFEAEA